MDIEAISLSALRLVIRQHQFRLPVTVAAVGHNGAALFTRFTRSAAGGTSAVEQEHVAGHLVDDGFGSPVHLLVTDATGRGMHFVSRDGAEPTPVR